MRRIGRRRGWLARRLGPGLALGGDGEDAGSLAGDLLRRDRGPPLVVPLRTLSRAENLSPLAPIVLEAVPAFDYDFGQASR